MSDIGEYKIIKGVRCIMIHPTPVTPDTIFPCAIRLVQDNSLMGKMNKRIELDYLVNTNGEFIAYRIEDDYEMRIQTSWGCSLPYEHFEVIGIIKPLPEPPKGEK